MPTTIEHLDSLELGNDIPSPEYEYFILLFVIISVLLYLSGSTTIIGIQTTPYLFIIQAFLISVITIVIQRYY